MGKSKELTRNAIDALDMYCKKANTRTLKKLALSLGAAVGVNKTIIRTNILTQAVALEELKRRRQKNGSISIVAIDAGISNFAYSKFRWSIDEKLPTLLEWDKFQLEEKFLPPHRKRMSLHPDDTSQVIYDLTEYLTSQKTMPDIFTIERQRARSLSSKSILEPILRVNILEQILFSNLRNKPKYNSGLKLDYLVSSSDPQRMTSYWCALTPTKQTLRTEFPKGSEELKLKISSNRLSKSIKIALVKRILEGALKIGDRRMVKLTPDWEQRLKGHIPDNSKFKLWDCVGVSPEFGVKKEDDLADSFLHGLAWMEWLRTYEEICDITLRDSGRYDQNILAEFNNYCKNKKLELQNFQQGTSSKLTELVPPEY